MIPAGISTPALTNLTHGWEFRYGGNNKRDTVLRSLKSITDNRKLGDGLCSSEYWEHSYIVAKNGRVNVKTRIERADGLVFTSTPDSFDVTRGNALADAIVNKDDP